MNVPIVLAVFAHPDDESLSAGGLLARTASEGGRTAVVTTTWAADSHRAMELAEALRFLGRSRPDSSGMPTHVYPNRRGVGHASATRRSMRPWEGWSITSATFARTSSLRTMPTAGSPATQITCIRTE